MKKNDWILLISTLLYSYLFYKEHAGINITIFTIVLTGLLLYRNKRLASNRRWSFIAAGAILTGIAAVLYGSWLTVWANVISLSILAGASVSPRSSVLMALFHSLYSYASSVVHMALDTMDRRAKGGASTAILSRIILVAIPLLITILFFFLYRGANAVFNNFANKIELNFFSWGWLLFTLLGFILLYGFFYHKRINKLSVFDENTPLTISSSGARDEGKQGLFSIQNQHHSGMILFVMLNLLLLFVNSLDMQYVFNGNVLPEGVSHSEYVHQGVGALIASIVIAIAIILFVFRGELNFYMKSRPLKILASLWILQNSLMLVSTIARNNMYISEYGGITYKRIGVYVYLVLALLGLVTTWVKIWRLKSNWYLFRVNSVMWFTILVISCFINWDAFITNYNVTHARSINDLDRKYLVDLGPAAFPEMLAVNDTSNVLEREFSPSDFPNEERYGIMERTLENKLHGQVYWFFEKMDSSGWQSWNYDDQAIANRIMEMNGEGRIRELKLQQLGLVTLHPIARLTGVLSLDLHANNLGNDLNGLHEFHYLEDLDISYNQISSLNRLPYLPKLETLSLRGNALSDINGLRNALRLESLDLAYGSIIDLKELPAFPKLRHLDTSETRIENFDSIIKFPLLESLDLTHSSGVSSFSLKGLDKLRWLEMDTTGLKYLGEIRDLTSLEHLNIASNDIKSLDGIQNLIKLRSLDISYTLINDLKPLHGLKDLASLTISSMPVAQVAELKKALPHLEIIVQQL